MVNISASDASSSTTSTRPFVGRSFAGACSAMRQVSPTGHKLPEKCGLARQELLPGQPDGSVPVVVRLVRALDRDAEVLGLLVGQRGQPHAERLEVQPG